MAIRITQPEGVFLALGTQHAMHMCHCHMWPAQLQNIFPPYLINGMILEKKVVQHEMCVAIFSVTCLKNFSLHA